MLETNKIYCIDCMEGMKQLPDESVDAIVTDPPYDLVQMTKRYGKENSKPCGKGTDGRFRRLTRGFMGKTWDGTGIACRIESLQFIGFEINKEYCNIAEERIKDHLKQKKLFEIT
jgi:DNA modification methylase